MKLLHDSNQTESRLEPNQVEKDVICVMWSGFGLGNLTIVLWSGLVWFGLALRKTDIRPSSCGMVWFRVKKFISTF